MPERPASELLREWRDDLIVADVRIGIEVVDAIIALVRAAEATVLNAQLVCDEEIVLDAALADLRTQLGGGSA